MRIFYRVFCHVPVAGYKSTTDDGGLLKMCYLEALNIVQEHAMPSPKCWARLIGFLGASFTKRFFFW